MSGKLTDKLIRSLVPKGKTYIQSDGDGMYLEVTPKGSKRWRLKYRIAGKENRLSLGIYPQVSLAEAREKCQAARKQIANGIDPSQARKDAEAQKMAEARVEEERRGTLFEAVAREYYEKKTIDLNPRYRKQYLSRIENILLPDLGQIPIRELKRTEILAVLRKLEAKAHFDTAHRVATIASQICRYARDCGLVEYDVADGLTNALSKLEHTPRAALTDPVEIGRMLQAIEGYNGDVSVRYALRIMPYVFVRSWELRGAKWSEIDFDEALWTIPASRMKRRREHIVPLARQVVALFDELRAFTGDSDYVFPSAFSTTQTISDMGLLNGLRRLGYGKGEMDIHGFRSIASTALNEMGVRSDVIEMQLSHAQKDSVRAAYNRAQYLDERTVMMQKYADYLDSLRAQA